MQAKRKYTQTDIALNCTAYAKHVHKCAPRVTTRKRAWNSIKILWSSFNSQKTHLAAGEMIGREKERDKDLNLCFSENRRPTKLVLKNKSE